MKLTRSVWAVHYTPVKPHQPLRWTGFTGCECGTEMLTVPTVNSRSHVCLVCSQAQRSETSLPEPPLLQEMFRCWNSQVNVHGHCKSIIHTWICLTDPRQGRCGLLYVLFLNAFTFCVVCLLFSLRVLWYIFLWVSRNRSKKKERKERNIKLDFA